MLRCGGEIDLAPVGEWMRQLSYSCSPTSSFSFEEPTMKMRMRRRMVLPAIFQTVLGADRCKELRAT
jgi:hypothetical protein